MVEHALAFEIQHRVDDVLECLRTGDSSFACDVSNDEHGDPRFFRKAHQPCRALTHLSDASGCTIEIRSEYRLDRIDDENRRRLGGGSRNDRLEQCLPEEIDIARLIRKPVSSQLHLERRLLSRDVQRSVARCLELRRDLEQESRFADARLSADQDHRAWNDSAAEDKIEFTEPRFPSRLGLSGDVSQPDRRRD